ncbi:aldose 1-epimerase family protein [Proteiniclasticum sp. C24MP]|uniref:aldose 1-epimerase family protein n=1 Tax=Proteiniclasticum sp. C24MP TaxID=3374101 RepID=UPI003754BAEE
MIVLQNTYLSIELTELGAELVSIKDMEGQEYLLRDEKYWGYSAPHLFPVVGVLNQNQLLHQGISYPVRRHGFARNMPFSILERTENKVSFLLESSEETLKLYPFHFRFIVEYILEGKKITVGYKTENTGETDLAYSVGAHPAFLAPRNRAESFTDYYLEFQHAEDLQTIGLDSQTGLLKRNKSPFGKNVTRIDLEKSLFKEDALIFQNLKSEYLSLKSRKSNKEVRFHIREFPFLGIWTTSGSSPFICIEPWAGHADYEDFHGEFMEKEDNILLKPHEIRVHSYSIEIRY